MVSPEAHLRQSRIAIPIIGSCCQHRRSVGGMSGTRLRTDFMFPTAPSSRVSVRSSHRSAWQEDGPYMNAFVVRPETV
jgi:hypothetical protein